MLDHWPQEMAMSLTYRLLKKLVPVICFCGAVLGSCLPAEAEFLPEKGVAVKHWKEPPGGNGFSRYYWLNDHALVYLQHTPGLDGQYCKVDLTTGKEETQLGFTKIVKGTVGNWPLPEIIPSPDRKYLAWIGTITSYKDTLVVATIDGSIISCKPNKTRILYPAWSADSKWCFGFLSGQVPDETFRGFFRSVFSAISAVSVRMPYPVKTHPIALKPEGTPNPLSGYSYIPNAINHMGAPALLPAFHFGSENNILLVSPILSGPPGDIQFDEYDFLVDTTMPVSTHTLHLPAFGEFVYAVLSPQGDAIVWKFQRAEDEFWISDKGGGHMKRIGKFSPTHKSRNPDHMQWLPDGKGFSFIDDGELYVVKTT
jgi:hypothetical protein